MTSPRMYPAGQITPMTDDSGAALIDDETTRTNAAVKRQVIPAVGEALADPETSGIVSGAATIAVAKAVEEEPTLPKLFATEENLLEETDAAGNITRTVRRTDGATWVKLAADSVVPAEGLTGPITYGSDALNFFVVEVGGWELFAIRRDGSTVIGRHDGAVPTGPKKVGGLGILLQSNAADRALTSVELDTPFGKLTQFPSIGNPDLYGQILPAGPGLYHHDRPYTPATQGFAAMARFGRDWLELHPEYDEVLLVPGAHGGTGFSTSSITPLPAGMTAPNPGGGCWQLNKADEPINLAQRFIQQGLDAKATITARGDTFEWIGLWAVGGEADQAMARTTFEGHLDTLVPGIRTAWGVPDLPVVFGQPVPEGMDAIPGRYQIGLSLIDTPRRLARTAFVYGQRNAFKDGDTTHYERGGQQHLGARLVRAIEVARLNVTGRMPAQVVAPTATRVGTTVTLAWTWPLGRVTSYAISWSTDGATWQTTGITQETPLDCRAVLAVGTASPVSIRIAVTNESGTSAATTLTNI